MIVSHEHRFVFVKTHKTAGTSIEVLLAEHAGPDAIVTPLTPAVPGHEPRNFDGRFNPLPQIVRTRQLRPALWDLRRHVAFENHLDLTRIRERVGRRRLDGYFTFCFERDPWEKVASYWGWKGQHRHPDFRTFVLEGQLPSDFDAYSVDGEVAVDFVGRYEHLEEDLTSVLRRVGIDAPATLGHEKPGPQPAATLVDELFTPELDERVATVFAREISALGYEDRSRRSQ